MRDINVVCITGHATRDSELRVTPTGTKVLTFGVAVNDSRKDPNDPNKWIEVPNFINCVVYGERSATLQELVKKGTFVSVSGKFHYNAWQDKDGRNRHDIEIIVDTIRTSSRLNGNNSTQTVPQITSDEVPISAYSDLF